MKEAGEEMRHHRLVSHLLKTALLAVALAVGLPALSWAADPAGRAEGFLRDGTKFERVARQLFLIDKLGKKSLARDGNYVTTAGKQFVIKNGRILTYGPLGKRPPARRPGSPAGRVAEEEKEESFYWEDDPSVEYADDKTRLGDQPIKGKILKQQPGQVQPSK